MQTSIAPTPPRFSGKSSRPQSARSAASRLIHTPFVRPSAPPSRQSSHVKSSSEVLRDIMRSVMSTYTSREDERSNFVSERPGVAPFSCTFHVPTNLEMRLYAHRALTNSRMDPMSERLPDPYTSEPYSGRCAAAAPVGKAAFRTTWRTPRCLDMKLDAFRSLSLGMHRDPYMGVQESMRQSAAELQQKVENAEKMAQSRSRERPETPRSVVRFFGSSAEEFVAQDAEYQKAWRLRLSRAKQPFNTAAAAATLVSVQRAAARPTAATLRSAVGHHSAAAAVKPQPPPPPQPVEVAAAAATATVAEDPRDVYAWLARQQWPPAVAQRRN